jgi:hypothetical protein
MKPKQFVDQGFFHFLQQLDGRAVVVVEGGTVDAGNPAELGDTYGIQVLGFQKLEQSVLKHPLGQQDALVFSFSHRRYLIHSFCLRKEIIPRKSDHQLGDFLGSSLNAVSQPFQQHMIAAGVEECGNQVKALLLGAGGVAGELVIEPV